MDDFRAGAGGLRRLLSRLRQQRDELEDELTPIEQALGLPTLHGSPRTALERRARSLRHQRASLDGLIDQLVDQVGDPK